MMKKMVEIEMVEVWIVKKIAVDHYQHSCLRSVTVCMK